MKELKVKKDFTNIYTQNFPNAYLKEMKRLHYRIPDHTKPLYLSLAQQLCRKLSRPIHVLDIGSSYGINSSLMKYDLKMSDLDEFFLKEKSPTKEQTKQFFENHTSNDMLNIYQIDISKPAIQFSEDVGLCEQGFCVDLEENDTINNMPEFDMIIATGCIGYIGYQAFSNLFELFIEQNSDASLTMYHKIAPIFAFSVLRIFDMKKIEKTFDHYGYFIIKSDLKSIRQRRFSDSEEKNKTLSLLHGKGINTKWHEDDGHFYADFYVASPKKIENQLIAMSKKLKSIVEDN